MSSRDLSSQAPTRTHFGEIIDEGRIKTEEKAMVEAAVWGDGID